MIIYLFSTTELNTSLCLFLLFQENYHINPFLIRPETDRLSYPFQTTTTSQRVTTTERPIHPVVKTTQRAHERRFPVEESQKTHDNIFPVAYTDKPTAKHTAQPTTITTNFVVDIHTTTPDSFSFVAGVSSEADVQSSSFTDSSTSVTPETSGTLERFVTSASIDILEVEDVTEAVSITDSYEESSQTVAPLLEIPVDSTSSTFPSEVPLWPTTASLPFPTTAAFSTVLSQTTQPVFNGESAPYAPSVSDTLSYVHASPVSPYSLSSVLSEPIPDWDIPYTVTMLVSGGAQSITPSPSYPTLSLSGSVSYLDMESVSSGGCIDDDGDDAVLSGSASADPPCRTTLPLQTLSETTASVEPMQPSSEPNLLHLFEHSSTISVLSTPAYLQPSVPVSKDYSVTTTNLDTDASLSGSNGESNLLTEWVDSSLAAPTFSSEISLHASSNFLLPSSVSGLSPCSGLLSDRSSPVELHLFLSTSSASTSLCSDTDLGLSSKTLLPSLSISTKPSSDLSISVAATISNIAQSAIGQSLGASAPIRSSTITPTSTLDLRSTPTPVVPPTIAPTSPSDSITVVAPVVPPTIPVSSAPESSSMPTHSADGQQENSASGWTFDLDWGQSSASGDESITAPYITTASPTEVSPEETDDGNEEHSSSFYFEGENGTESEATEFRVTLQPSPSWTLRGSGEEESGSGENLTDNETSSDFSIPERTERESEEEPVEGKALDPFVKVLLDLDMLSEADSVNYHRRVRKYIKTLGLRIHPNSS